MVNTRTSALGSSASTSYPALPFGRAGRLRDQASGRGALGCQSSHCACQRLGSPSDKYRTSLVIGLTMTTAEYNADNPFAVAAGVAGGAKAGKASDVLCHQPKSFDWRARQARRHPMKQISHAAFVQVFGLLNQIIALA